MRCDRHLQRRPLAFVIMLFPLLHLSSALTEGSCDYQTSPTACPISSFAEDVTTIFPRGETRCYLDPFNGEPNPFFFQVYQRERGTTAGSRNLHIHLAGGGFCTGLQSECLTESPSILQFIRSFLFGGIAFAFVQPEVKQHKGIFSPTPENPFGTEEWTHVRILYCSGDTHIGNTAADQGNLEYRGALNTFAALEWAYQNIPNPERLLLTGLSAGSLGLQHWAHSILEHYKSSSNSLITTTVVLDSYIGVIEPATIPLRHDWGICNAVFGWPTDLMNKCLSRSLEPKNAQLFNQQQHPDTPFAFINNKFDFVQQNSACEFFCTQQSLYRDMQDLLLELMQSTSNGLSYFVNGIGHTSLDEDTFFTLGSSSLWNPGLSLSDFIHGMVYRTSETVVQSQCTRWIFPFLDWGCNTDLRNAFYQDP